MVSFAVNFIARIRCGQMVSKPTSAVRRGCLCYSSLGERDIVGVDVSCDDPSALEGQGGDGNGS